MNLRESEFLRLEVHFPGDAGGLWRRLDKDHSGTIEHTELREALLKAGKKPTDAQCKTVLEKYAKSQKGSMTFEEYFVRHLWYEQWIRFGFFLDLITVSRGS